MHKGRGARAGTRVGSGAGQGTPFGAGADHRAAPADHPDARAPARALRQRLRRGPRVAPGARRPRPLRPGPGRRPPRPAPTPPATPTPRARPAPTAAPRAGHPGRRRPRPRSRDLDHAAPARPGRGCRRAPTQRPAPATQARCRLTSTRACIPGRRRPWTSTTPPPCSIAFAIRLPGDLREPEHGRPIRSAHPRPRGAPARRRSAAAIGRQASTLSDTNCERSIASGGRDHPAPRPHRVQVVEHQRGAPELEVDGAEAVRRERTIAGRRPRARAWTAVSGPRSSWHARATGLHATGERPSRDGRRDQPGARCQPAAQLERDHDSMLPSTSRWPTPHTLTTNRSPDRLSLWRNLNACESRVRVWPRDRKPQTPRNSSSRWTPLSDPPRAPGAARTPSWTAPPVRRRATPDGSAGRARAIRSAGGRLWAAVSCVAGAPAPARSARGTRTA